MGLTVPPAETAWLLSRVVGFSALDQADIAAILEESTSLAEGVLAPLDRAGDTIGAKWNAGRVTLPDGFDAAFRAYAEAGWIGIAAEEKPLVANACVVRTGVALRSGRVEAIMVATAPGVEPLRFCGARLPVIFFWFPR